MAKNLPRIRRMRVVITFWETRTEREDSTLRVEPGLPIERKGLSKTWVKKGLLQSDPERQGHSRQGAIQEQTRGQVCSWSSSKGDWGVTWQVHFKQITKTSIIWWQVGFMNSGRIKALDIECYVNGGCTLDDSELVCVSETNCAPDSGWDGKRLKESLWKGAVVSNVCGISFCFR